MSDKEKGMVEKIAALPPALQEKMLDTLNGAVMAIDALGAGRQERDEKEGDA